MTTPNTSGNEGQHSGGGFTRWVYLDTGEVFKETLEGDGFADFDAPIASLPAPDDHVGALIAAAPLLLLRLTQAIEVVAEEAASLRDSCTNQATGDVDPEAVEEIERLEAIRDLGRAAISKALGTAPGSVGGGSDTDDSSAQSQPLADKGPQPCSHDNHSFDGKEGQ